MYQVRIEVTPKYEVALSDADSELIGTYTVDIDDSVPNELAATAALDTFAVNIPTDNPESVTLSVTDEQGNPMDEMPDADTYTLDKEAIIVDFQPTLSHHVNETIS